MGQKTPIKGLLQKKQRILVVVNMCVFLWELISLGMKKTLPLFFIAGLSLGTPLFSRAADSTQVQAQVQPQVQMTTGINPHTPQHNTPAPAESTPAWMYALLGGSLLACGLLGAKALHNGKANARRQQRIEQLEAELAVIRTAIEASTKAAAETAPPAQPAPSAPPVSHYASSRMQVIDKERPLHKQDLAALADEMVESDNLGYLDMLAHGQPMQNERSQQTDPNALVDKALDLINPLLEQGHVGVEKTLGRLPQLSCKPRMLTQALVDLFRHSLRDLPEHGKLSVSTYMYMGQVQISITDNGQGMDMESPVRGHSTNQALLSACKHTIEAHGGTIEVNSQPKVGTEFVITLPIQG